MPIQLIELPKLRSLELGGYDDCVDANGGRAGGLAADGFKVLSRLKGLEKLTISFSKLKTVPIEICSLTSLTSLNLSYNDLNVLPECLVNLKSLRSLNLGQNNFRALPLWLSKLQQLESIELGDNGLRTVIDAVVGLRHLKNLVIENDYDLDPAEENKISEAERLRLQKMLPGLRFQHSH